MAKSVYVAFPQLFKNRGITYESEQAGQGLTERGKEALGKEGGEQEKQNSGRGRRKEHKERHD